VQGLAIRFSDMHEIVKSAKMWLKSFKLFTKLTLNKSGVIKMQINFKTVRFTMFWSPAPFGHQSHMQQ
jgi:hypothetical protein